MTDQPAAETTLLASPRFDIITKDLSITATGTDGRRRFRAVASSTITDHAGDEIDVEALQKAATYFRKGLTVYINHEFKDVTKAFGLTDNAIVKQTGEFDPKTGKPIYDLEIEGVVNTPNPNAVQLADSIDGGYARFGTSVTAFVRKWSRNAAGRMKIMDIEPIEASIVGVPENQRSWALKGAMAIKALGMTEMPTDEEETVPEGAAGEAGPQNTTTLSEGNTVSTTVNTTYPVQTSSTVVQKSAMSAATRNDLGDSDFACPEQRKYPINDAAHVRAALSRIADPSNEQCGRDKIVAAAKKFGIAVASKALEGEADVSDDLVVAWAAEHLPQTGITTAEDGSEVYLGENEPEVLTPEANAAENAAEAVEGTADEGGQTSDDPVVAETSETSPETPETAPADEVLKAASLDIAPSDVAELIGWSEKAVREIERLRGENAALIQKNLQLEQAATQQAAEVQGMNQIISKALQMPLQAQTAQFVVESAKAHPMFAPAVQEFLSKRGELR